MPTAAVVVGVPSDGLDLLLAHAGRDLRQVVLVELVAVLGDGLGAGRQRDANQRRQGEAAQTETCSARGSWMMLPLASPARAGADAA